MAPSSRSRPVRLAAVTAAVLLAVSGCSMQELLDFKPFAEPSSVETAAPLVDTGIFAAGDLRDLFDTADSPDGTAFVSDFYLLTLDSTNEYAASTWDEASGSPESCFASFAASFLASPARTGANKALAYLGGFDYDYSTQGVVSMSARVFSDSTRASLFLDEVALASQECSEGYTLWPGDDSWEVDSVTATEATNLGLPDGARVLHHEDVAAEWMSIQYRDSFIQFENAVILVTCEVHRDSPFGFDDCDVLAQTAAARLAALK